ncbi:hypothetical protein [uncultured Clostridium sp.]|uniref:hypothetical protein n=1 Tax=uncultured Clostridium sp. TaxID=59620 RepID=UPI002672410F|nr:hypothetical protein [uncultured Clostridium sp.]
MVCNTEVMDYSVVMMVYFVDVMDSLRNDNGFAVDVSTSMELIIIFCILKL